MCNKDITDRIPEQETEEYENGKYSEEQLLTVEKTADVPEVALVYCYGSSTFYLPEQELSEQQILKIIDFRYKRDYALIEENWKEQPANESLDHDLKQ